MYLERDNYDLMFKDTLNPIVINDKPYIHTEERLHIMNLLMTTYDDSDILSSVPSCFCGSLRGGKYLKMTCEVCGSTVSPSGEGDIDLRLWMRVPDGVVGFMRPNIFAYISALLGRNLAKSTSDFNILTWMMSSSVSAKKVSVVNQKRIAYLESIGWVRSLNYLAANYLTFINDIIPKLVGTKNKKLLEAQKYLLETKDEAFSQYLPIPSKVLIVLETTPVKSYADLTISGVIDAVKTILSISSTKCMITPKRLEQKTVSVIESLSEYYVTTLVKLFFPKGGWFRGQVFKSKTHFSARGVITSINVKHDYEELHIPWSMGCEIFKVHLVSKLRKMGYAVKRAYAFIEAHVVSYHPLLDKLFQELIYEAHHPKITNPDFRGIPCIFQRNPSLGRLSGQNLFITKVKSDLTDNTVSLSVLVLVGFNADGVIIVDVLIYMA